MEIRAAKKIYVTSLLKDATEAMSLATELQEVSPLNEDSVL